MDGFGLEFFRFVALIGGAWCFGHEFGYLIGLGVFWVGAALLPIR